MHDAVGDDALPHRRRDRARAADLVDRAHVQPVSPRRRFPAPAHAERGAEDRGLDVVDRDGVAGEERTDESVADEPHHVAAGP